MILEFLFSHCPFMSEFESESTSGISAPLPLPNRMLGGGGFIHVDKERNVGGKVCCVRNQGYKLFLSLHS